MAATRAAAPLLEKVQAHNEAWLRLQHPKAVGNDSADASARRAASDSGVPVFDVDLSVFDNPVSILDASGREVDDVQGGIAALWWDRR